MIPPPDDTIETQWLLRPCVYAWKRGAIYLYVGMSSRGLTRPLSNHHVIGKCEFVGPEDVFEVWRFERVSHAAIFETLAIYELKPKYNGDFRVNQHCQVCGNTWRSRKHLPPKKCPNPRCQSFNWNGPSTYPSRKGKQGARPPETPKEPQ